VLGGENAAANGTGESTREGRERSQRPACAVDVVAITIYPLPGAWLERATDVSAKVAGEFEEHIAMNIYRSCYVMFEGSSLADRLAALYQGKIAEDDPLHSLQSQRGEVASWGGPHITLLDALTTADPDTFDRIVIKVVGGTRPPEIRPLDLALFGSSSLVILCESPDLDNFRPRLIQATRPLMTSQPLADEEVQRAYWWIDLKCPGLKGRHDLLDLALRTYRDAGSPPLPNSRHFRLGFLAKLCHERKAAAVEECEERQARLDYFLSLGEPPWYSRPGGLHLTIVSGLKLQSGATVGPFRDQLWEAIRHDFTSYRPARLAIMGEDPERPVPVQCNDALTASYVPETRPGFKVVTWANFAFSP